ncbi:MAG: hypothetical protein IJW40_10935 [Clostridia bacterium]|nr:hypothetical protein [Clostridia bacterium]
MFKKNRTIWGIASLVSAYLSLFLSLVFAPDNKRAGRSMLLMSITQLICGLALIDEEYDVSGTVKSKSKDVVNRVKSKVRIPVADDEEIFDDDDDLTTVQEAIYDELCADE